MILSDIPPPGAALRGDLDLHARARSPGALRRDRDARGVGRLQRKRPRRASRARRPHNGGSARADRALGPCGLGPLREAPKLGVVTEALSLPVWSRARGDKA